MLNCFYEMVDQQALVEPFFQKGPLIEIPAGTLSLHKN